jgi:serine O-acetyltransferase
MKFVVGTENSLRAEAERSRARFFPSTRFELFGNIREDWYTHERHLFCQGLWAMTVYRFGRWRYTISWRWLRMPFSFLYKVLKPISEIMTGIELPCEVTLGRRFRIDHFGGIIISGDAVFGDDCVVRNGVTVGLRQTGFRGSPVLGNRVDIGSGAKILGPIRIGDDVAIGANAVVITDVPSNSIAVGVPARILPRRAPMLVASENTVTADRGQSAHASKL